MAAAYLEYNPTIISVTCPYSKCNPSLRDICIIMLLNILTLLACTQSMDNLFKIVMVIWENEYFLTSNPRCSFPSVKLSILVILLSLIKQIRISISITISYLKLSYLTPLIFVLLVLLDHIILFVRHI